MSAQSHSIFISYRRADSAYVVDQLDQRLKLAFGEEAAFRDASSLAAGAVFPERIRQALDVARVALVVIGPWWLRASLRCQRSSFTSTSAQPRPTETKTLRALVQPPVG